MQIDDAVDAVVALLQGDELDDGSEIVAEVQVAGWLHAREHPLLEAHAGNPADCAAALHVARSPRKGSAIFDARGLVGASEL